MCHIGNKVDELQGVAEINNASIAIVTESWLTSETPSSSISIGEYNIYRKDRNKRQGGGVVVYVENYLRSKRLSDLENEDKEVLLSNVSGQNVQLCSFFCSLIGQATLNDQKLVQKHDSSKHYLGIVVLS